MGKSNTLLLVAGLFFSILAAALVFDRRAEDKIMTGGIIRQETVPEEFRGGKIEDKTRLEEIIKKETETEAGIKEVNDMQESGDAESYRKLNWQWVNDREKLYSLTFTEVNLILAELKQRFSDKSERLRAISILRLGTPYQLGCLGEETSSLLTPLLFLEARAGEESVRDKNPIFRIDVADCTVFILTNVALLHSRTIIEAGEMMRFLNYQPDSEISFENRLHFTTDRNSVSSYFRDITEEIAGAKTQKKTVVLNKKRADGTRLIDIDWEREMVLKYIPSQHIDGDFLVNLPKVTGIAFIKEGDGKIGLDIRHEGFLFDGKTLIHASSARGKVVEENFLDYYFIERKNPRFDGIILFEIN